MPPTAPIALVLCGALPSQGEGRVRGGTRSGPGARSCQPSARASSPNAVLGRSSRRRRTPCRCRRALGAAREGPRVHVGWLPELAAGHQRLALEEACRYRLCPAPRASLRRKRRRHPVLRQRRLQRVAGIEAPGGDDARVRHAADSIFSSRDASVVGVKLPVCGVRRGDDGALVLAPLLVQVARRLVRSELSDRPRARSTLSQF